MQMKDGMERDGKNGWENQKKKQVEKAASQETGSLTHTSGMR